MEFGFFRFKTCRFALFAAVLVFAVSASLPVNAKYASLVMEAETGHILHAVNPDTRNYPASLTKMMTLYLIFEAVDTGRVTLDQRITFSARAARQPASKLALNAGQSISFRHAILALVTKSANDVASAIAEALGGTERKFALIMTAKARQIGMSRTTFRNASGLPHRGQSSSARDMAILARRLMLDFPHHYHHFSTLYFSFDGIRHKNHNKLLRKYPGTDGIKTGYIRASGFNLVASVVRKGHRLIGVVFGGRSPRARDRHMMALLDKGFRKLNQTTVVAQTERRKARQIVKNTAVTKLKPKTPKKMTKKRDQPKKIEKKQLTTIWAIQVGAYNRFAQALKMAKTVMSKFPSLLKDGTARVDPLKIRRRRPVYRARIIGLAKRQAYTACRQLKRRKIDCLEVRLRDYQLAYAGN